MDPVIEPTSQAVTRRRVRNRVREDKAFDRLRARERSKFEVWVWTELPAYRLGLLLGYSFAVYFGISALIAGVPAFTLTAPDGWTFIWACLLVIGGPIGLIGILQDTSKFRKTELLAAVIISWALSIYAVTVLFIAYMTGDLTRVAAGAALAWLASGPTIRMFWLVSAVSLDIRAKRTLVLGE